MTGAFGGHTVGDTYLTHNKVKKLNLSKIHKDLIVIQLIVVEFHYIYFPRKSYFHQENLARSEDAAMWF